MKEHMENSTNATGQASHNSQSDEQTPSVSEAVSRIADSFGELEKLKPKEPRLGNAYKASGTIEAVLSLPCFLLIAPGSLFTAIGVIQTIVALIANDPSSLVTSLAVLGCAFGVASAGVLVGSIEESWTKYVTEPKTHLRKNSLLSRFVRSITPKGWKVEITEYLQRMEIYDTEKALFKELVKAKKKEFAKEITAINSIFNDREIFIDNSGLVSIREFDKGEIVQPELTAKELIVKDIIDSIQRYGTVDLRELSQ